nr:MAG TPA: Transcription initiation factor IIE, alpha FINGER, Transcription [Siphoviridae sp. ctZYQ8]DAM05022.1 MAG TPA: Transcription initiation factor IIE, alpha FINGER, Transcription [Caudoviricetes sp.]
MCTESLKQVRCYEYTCPDCDKGVEYKDIYSFYDK